MALPHPRGRAESARDGGDRQRACHEGRARRARSRRQRCGRRRRNGVRARRELPDRGQHRWRRVRCRSDARPAVCARLPGDGTGGGVARDVHGWRDGVMGQRARGDPVGRRPGQRGGASPAVREARFEEDVMVGAPGSRHHAGGAGTRRGRGLRGQARRGAAREVSRVGCAVSTGGASSGGRQPLEEPGARRGAPAHRRAGAKGLLRGAHGGCDRRGDEGRRRPRDAGGSPWYRRSGGRHSSSLTADSTAHHDAAAVLGGRDARDDLPHPGGLRSRSSRLPEPGGPARPLRGDAARVRGAQREAGRPGFRHDAARPTAQRRVGHRAARVESTRGTRPPPRRSRRTAR